MHARADVVDVEQLLRVVARRSPGTSLRRYSLKNAPTATTPASGPHRLTSRATAVQAGRRSDLDAVSGHQAWHHPTTATAQSATFADV